MGPHQYDTLTGPLVGFVALLVVLGLCRWVFSTKGRDERAARRRAAALAAARSRGDFGLLVPIATVRTPEDAEMVRELLSGAGIRATVSPGSGPDDRVVLVFRRDEARARSLTAG